MSDADSAPASRKVRDRVQQLSELRRGLVHHTDAQYGTANDPTFVMHLTVDGVVSTINHGYVNTCEILTACILITWPNLNCQ